MTSAILETDNPNFLTMSKLYRIKKFTIQWFEIRSISVVKWHHCGQFSQPTSDKLHRVTILAFISINYNLDTKAGWREHDFSCFGGIYVWEGFFLISNRFGYKGMNLHGGGHVWCNSSPTQWKTILRLHLNQRTSIAHLSNFS